MLKISGKTKATKGIEAVTPLTNGSIPFGSGGKLGQDNAQLFWNDTNKRLGIGTSSPAQLLHVFGATNPTIQTEDSTNGLILRMQAQNTVGFVGTLTNHELRLITNNSAKITIQTGGNVGIGTIIPNAQLEVGGNPGAIVGGFASGQLHITAQSASVNANAVITGHNLFGGNKQLWYFGSTSSSNDNIAFINRQNGSLAFLTNNATRMTILAASNTLQGNAGMTLQGGSGVHTLTLSGGASAASSISIGIGNELIGFFGGSPAARPTGVGVTTAQIHAALVTLGLITV